MSGQSELQMCGTLCDRHPRGGGQQLQLARVLQLRVLFLGRPLRRAHLFPYRESVAVTEIDAEVFKQSMAGFCGQPADDKVDRSRDSREVIVMVIPDQDLDFMFLPRGNRADVRLSTHTIAVNILRTQGT